MKSFVKLSLLLNCIVQNSFYFEEISAVLIFVLKLIFHFRANAADHVLSLISDIREKHKGFIQDIKINGETGIPKVTMFYKWQIDLIRSNCIVGDKHKSTFGADKTFCLTDGKLYSFYLDCKMQKICTT